MKLKLELSGELHGQLLDERARAWPLADGATLAELVASLPFAERVALTSVNGAMVPPAGRAGVTLADGDEIMLLPPMKGG